MNSLDVGIDVIAKNLDLETLDDVFWCLKDISKKKLPISPEFAEKEYGIFNEEMKITRRTIVVAENPNSTRDKYQMLYQISDYAKVGDREVLIHSGNVSSKILHGLTFEEFGVRTNCPYCDK